MIAVLFTQERSVYRAVPWADLWPASRDARLYSGPWPVVAHPPCRGWGKFKHVAKVQPGERELAFFAVDAVRRFGGVLEHPVGSALWREAALPPVDGLPDQFGGVTWRVDQVRWGHRALKPTLLYVVGAAGRPDLPPAAAPVTTVERMCRQERERTPLSFALWLAELARSCEVRK